ncbi:MAG: hypothetical protein ACI37O_07810 [Candidatus Avelusimicrobium sp.]|uniref:hypothetical protein n=1 Tax=Candidatus Avelusimicrobium sp. TaxID=3048833 RepID=UPI003F07F821
MSFDFTCPFCGQKHNGKPSGETVLFSCLGEFYLDYSGCEDYICQGWTNLSARQIAWAKIAFEAAHKSIFYKRIPYTGAPEIDFKQVLENVELPTPAKQADLLIDYVGKKTKFLGCFLEVNAPGFGEGYPQLKAWIGGAGAYSVQRIFEDLVAKGLLRKYDTPNTQHFKLELTIAGWNRFEELQQVNKESKQAFMAMKFDDEQKQFIKDKLKPVVKETGFDLLLLTDINSKENLIDNKLRVAIRQSRFLICDLTHCNAGAYWEAGYAEGLKLPVIYICEKSAFDDEDKTKRPHFDVNHQEIFQWDKNNEESIKDFLGNIKAKIQVMLE